MTGQDMGPCPMVLASPPKHFSGQGEPPGAQAQEAWGGGVEQGDKPWPRWEESPGGVIHGGCRPPPTPPTIASFQGEVGDGKHPHRVSPLCWQVLPNLR